MHVPNSECKRSSRLTVLERKLLQMMLLSMSARKRGCMNKSSWSRSISSERGTDHPQYLLLIRIRQLHAQ